MQILNKFCSNIFIRYKIGIEQKHFFHWNYSKMTLTS